MKLQESKKIIAHRTSYRSADHIISQEEEGDRQRNKKEERNRKKKK